MLLDAVEPDAGDADVLGGHEGGSVLTRGVRGLNCEEGEEKEVDTGSKK
jgi:hypothetical protein